MLTIGATADWGIIQAVSNFPVSLESLQKKVAKFRDERNWRQYHNPKNLVLSILIEAAELAEHFQWETPDEAENHSKSVEKKFEIAMELADVIIYCLQLADVMDIDLAEAIIEKLRRIKEKFPKDKAGDLEFIKRQRTKYKFMELGGSLKSSVKLSDKQLRQARKDFETSWAER